jgi:enoyl-CoA hydratase
MAEQVRCASPLNGHARGRLQHAARGQRPGDLRPGDIGLAHLLLVLLPHLRLFRARRRRRRGWEQKLRSSAMLTLSRSAASLRCRARSTDRYATLGKEVALADPLVLYDVDDKVGIVTLNRPDKLNAISHELQHALTEAFVRADADPATSVVLLRAEGRSFCAGYDIGGKGPDADDWRSDPTKAHAHLQPQLEFEMAPWLMKKPVIASVQGHVLGGGCELVMLCDLTIAADNATFGEPEVRFSAVGPAIVMPMIVGYKKARELLYFGDQIDAQTALNIGMINRIVPLAELPSASLNYAKRLSLISPQALYATKRAVNRVADATGFRTALYAGLDVVGPLYATGTEHGTRFREIARTEGVPAAVQWRSAQFKG